MATLRTVGDSSFDTDVLKVKGLNVVEFGAPWCAPCKAMEPVLKALAAEKAGVVAIFNIDTDENPDASERYGIRGLPTVLFFKDGEVVDKLIGGQSKQSLEKVMARHI